MKSIFIAALLLLTLTTRAQILKPVLWSYGYKKTGQTSATIYIKANIDPSWHIYSVNQKPGGPIPTNFVFETSLAYLLNGNIMEPKPITKFEKTFHTNVSYFENQVIFSQKVDLRSSPAIVKGTLTFMTCNNQRCLPPEDVAFSIPIK